MTQTAVPSVLNIKEAAEYLGIEPATLQKWVQKRLIPHYRYPLPTSRPRFKKVDLDRFMEGHRLEVRRAWPAGRMRAIC